MPLTLDVSDMELAQGLKQTVDFRRADQDEDGCEVQMPVETAQAQEIVILPVPAVNIVTENGEVRTQSEFRGLMLTPNDAIKSGDIVIRQGDSPLYVIGDPKRVAKVQWLNLDSKVR